MYDKNYINVNDVYISGVCGMFEIYAINYYLDG